MQKCGYKKHSEINPLHCTVEMKETNSVQSQYHQKELWLLRTRLHQKTHFMMLLLFVFFAPLTELGYMNPIITFVFKIGCPK